MMIVWTFLICTSLQNGHCEMLYKFPHASEESCRTHKADFDRPTPKVAWTACVPVFVSRDNG